MSSLGEKYVVVSNNNTYIIIGLIILILILLAYIYRDKLKSLLGKESSPSPTLDSVIPQVGTSTAPQVGTPTAPQVGTPSAPQVGTPSAPQGGTPILNTDCVFSEWSVCGADGKQRRTVITPASGNGMCSTTREKDCEITRLSPSTAPSKPVVVPQGTTGSAVISGSSIRLTFPKFENAVKYDARFVNTFNINITPIDISLSSYSVTNNSDGSISFLIPISDIRGIIASSYNVQISGYNINGEKSSFYSINSFLNLSNIGYKFIGECKNCNDGSSTGSYKCFNNEVEIDKSLCTFLSMSEPKTGSACDSKTCPSPDFTFGNGNVVPGETSVTITYPTPDSLSKYKYKIVVSGNEAYDTGGFINVPTRNPFRVDGLNAGTNYTIIMGNDHRYGGWSQKKVNFSTDRLTNKIPISGPVIVNSSSNIFNSVISGNTLITADETGKINTYILNNDKWTEIQSFTIAEIEGKQIQPKFISLSMTNNVDTFSISYVYIDTSNSLNNYKKSYIFTRSNNTSIWNLQQRKEIIIDNKDGKKEFPFGVSSLSLSGDGKVFVNNCFIFSKRDSNNYLLYKIVVYVYNRNSSNDWILTDTIYSKNDYENNGFTNITINPDGKLITIGNAYKSVLIYRKANEPTSNNPNGWVLESEILHTEIDPDIPTEYDYNNFNFMFGYSVSFTPDNKTIFIGCLNYYKNKTYYINQNINTPPPDGCIYVLSLSTSGKWELKQILSNDGISQGRSLNIYQDTLVENGGSTFHVYKLDRISGYWNRAISLSNNNERPWLSIPITISGNKIAYRGKVYTI